MDDATLPTSAAPNPTGGVPPSSDPLDLTGKTLDDFHVLRQLGQGGMGKVYLAEQVSLKRKVALKIMKAELAANAAALQRFELEAKRTAQLTHANIVQVYAIGRCDGLHYMALEYVEGKNLREYLLKKGPPDLLLALTVMRQVAAALQRAGELGIVHRDIKPENILLTRKGEVKVADFGLSRCFDGDQPALNITQSGMTMGTPLYMSPEQVQGKPVDWRSDIYSFGVTCYHMLAGQPPFRGQTAFEVAMNHVQAEPAPLGELRPDLPPELCAIIHKMMAKDPDERFQSGREILKELTRLRETLNGLPGRPLTDPVVLSQSSIPAVPTVDLATAKQTGSLTLAPPPRRRWMPFAIALTVVLALGAGVALGLRQHFRRPPPPPPPVADDAPTRLPVPPTGRERFLLEAVKQDFDAADISQVMRALLDRIELGILYLEQDRLDEADRFFRDLMDNPPVKPPIKPPVKPPAPSARPFIFLGTVGHAIVLAFRDETKESNELFREVLREGLPEAKRMAGAGPLRIGTRPELRLWIAKALQHNHENATADAPFPKDLEYLRKPPPPTLFPAGGARPGTTAPMAKGKDG